MLNTIKTITNVRKVKLINYLLLVLLIGLVSIAMVPHVSANKSDGIETVIHIYVDDEYIGKVDDEKVIQNVINDKVEKQRQAYPDLELMISESISFVSEKVFKPKYNNAAVITFLEENITVATKATELKVDDQLIGYFKNDETVEEVLKAYKLKYVGEDVLEMFETENKKTPPEAYEVYTEIAQESQKNKAETSSPRVGETIIKDVSFSKAISKTKHYVLPKQVLNVKQGVTLLENGTLEDKKHVVSKGEVLEKIGNTYNLTIDELLQLNEDLTEDSILHIEQKINVTEFKSIVDVIIVEEEKVEEKLVYEIEVIESEEMNKGDEKVKQEGKDGKKEVHYQVEKRNNHVVTKKALDEEIIKEPVHEIIIKGTYVIPSKGTGNLSWPADGGYVSSHVGSRWGRMHNGIDIARPSSRKITTADHGSVESAGWDGGFGNKVVINHNNGMKTIYAHLSSITVKPGQTVSKGTQIGIMGTTGNSTGVHLHFEVYQNGVLQNPLKFF